MAPSTAAAVARYDRVIAALGRSPLPPRDLVASAVRSRPGDARRVCRLWAIHLACDAHTQNPPGERWARVGNDEASRYSDSIPLFEQSKSAAGGATSLTRHGFNGLLYGEAELRAGLAPDPARHLLTNDGVRGGGYRLIADGGEVAAVYLREAEAISERILREFFLVNLGAALDSTGPVDFRPSSLPDHHRLFARLTYARNRRRGYLDLSLGKANAHEAATILFGTSGPGPVGLRLLPGGLLRVAPDPEGWKLTESGRVQATTLRRAGIPEPDDGARPATRSVALTPADGFLSCPFHIIPAKR